MIKILEHTPLWVYCIFILILYTGISGAKSREIHIYKIFILPLVCITLSLSGLRNGQDLELIIPQWIGGGIIGAILSYCSLRKCKITLGAKTRTLVVPGSILNLIIQLTFFFMQYSLGYLQAINGDLFRLNTQLLLLSSSFSGLTISFVCIRTYILLTNYLRCSGQ